ncbi:MAG: sigma 54-interacting transcriptional regulator [Polyangiaceae bacterium]
MSKHRTGVSSSYSGADDSGKTEVQPRPGIVLLYAPNFDQLYPAYVFSSNVVVVGRDAANPICIPEQAVSRQHARFSSVQDAWILWDLGSRNGTIVNGAFIREHALEHLDEVRVGDAVFKFVETGAERFVPYRIDGAMFAPRKSEKLTDLVGGAQVDFIAADLERIAPTELSCMILGETGTGKEVAARALHQISGRRGSFQAINCAAIPQALLESELFGYRRGAFSGADRDKPGLVKLADGGTLFLDEIGDMPLEAQAKLLRVLQAHEVFPLGGTTPEKVDIRVVCATHRDLFGLVKSEKFRGDLFARLNEHAVKLPPLRERKEDLYRLCHFFLARFGQQAVTFTFSAMVALIHYDWPFNVRELESCIKRAVALANVRDNMGRLVIDVVHLPEQISDCMKGYADRKQNLNPSVMPGHVASFPPVSPRRGTPSEEELRDLLTRHHGNIAAVGRELGKERMQVHRWLKKYNIDLEQYRDETR